MENFIYDEVKSSEIVLASNGGGAEVVVKGNNAFEALLGFLLLITKADGSVFTGKANVAVTTTQGFILLPSQPYHAIRPSFQERHQDRIIKMNGVKGYEQDFRFRVEANVGEPLTITAIAYYSRKKN